MPTEIKPHLAEVMALFTNGDKRTNKEIAELLGITHNAAYKRSRELRDLGLLHSYPDWKTINDEGGAAWRDESGNMRSWLVLYRARTNEPDEVQSIFDPRRNNGQIHSGG